MEEVISFIVGILLVAGAFVFAVGRPERDAAQPDCMMWRGMPRHRACRGHSFCWRNSRSRLMAATDC